MCAQASSSQEGATLTQADTGRWKLGLSLSLVATLLWGTLPIALKIVVAALDPLTVVFYRFLFATVILGLILRARRLLPRFDRLRPGMLLLLGIAVVGCAGNNVVFLMGLDRTTPSAAQVVIQLAPMFLLLGAVAFFREAFLPYQWLGFAVLIAGLALFFHRNLDELVSNWSGFGIGPALIVGAAVLWAAYGLSQKRLLSVWHSGAIMWTIYVVGAVVLLPLARPADLMKLDGFRLLVLIYCGFNTLIGYGSFSEALAHWEASRVSAVVATTPLITVALMPVASRAFPDYLAPERLSPWSILGAVLVVAGSFLAAVRVPRRSASLTKDSVANRDSTSS